MVLKYLISITLQLKKCIVVAGILITSQKGISQITDSLKSAGIGQLTLGRNIKELTDVIPFGSSGLKDYFSVHPAPENFFVYTKQISIDSLNDIKVKYAIVTVTPSGVINKLTFFIDDPDTMMSTMAKQLPGRGGWEAIMYPGHTFSKTWITNSEVYISIFYSDQPYSFPEGTNCKADFTMLHDSETHKKYRINYNALMNLK